MSGHAGVKIMARGEVSKWKKYLPQLNVAETDWRNIMYRAAERFEALGHYVHRTGNWKKGKPQDPHTSFGVHKIIIKKVGKPTKVQIAPGVVVYTFKMGEEPITYVDRSEGSRFQTVVVNGEEESAVSEKTISKLVKKHNIKWEKLNNEEWVKL